MAFYLIHITYVLICVQILYYIHLSMNFKYSIFHHRHGEHVQSARS